jgi:hypothetical protein
MRSSGQFGQVLFLHFAFREGHTGHHYQVLETISLIPLSENYSRQQQAVQGFRVRIVLLERRTVLKSSGDVVIASKLHKMNKEETGSRGHLTLQDMGINDDNASGPVVVTSQVLTRNIQGQC